MIEIVSGSRVVSMAGRTSSVKVVQRKNQGRAGKAE